MDYGEEVSLSAQGITVAVSQLEPDETDLYLDVSLGEAGEDTFGTSCTALGADATLAERVQYVSAVLPVLAAAVEGVYREEYGTRQLEAVICEMAWRPAEEIARCAVIDGLIERFRAAVPQAAA